MRRTRTGTVLLSLGAVLALVITACGGDAGQPAATARPASPPATQSPALTATQPPAATPTFAPTRPPATAVPTPAQAPTSPPVTPTRVELTPSRDATLFQDDAGAVANGAGEGLFAGSTNNRSVRRALVAFDLTSIPRGSVVSLVEIRLTVTRTQSDPQNVALHRVAADWTQGASDAAGNEGGGAPAATGDATWVHRSFDRTRWARPGGDFAETPSAGLSVAGDGPVTFPSTTQLVADVQSWVNSPEQNFGWALVGNERDAQTAKRFASREAADARVRPTLIVELLPPR